MLAILDRDNTYRTQNEAIELHNKNNERMLSVRDTIELDNESLVTIRKKDWPGFRARIVSVRAERTPPKRPASGRST